MIKFSPKDANDFDNVNVSKVSEKKEFAVLVSGLLGVISLIYLISGWVLNIVIDRVPYKVEESVASIIDFSQFLTPPEFKDQQKKIQDIVDRLSMLEGYVQKRTLSIDVVDEEEVNAFAFPGGHIVIFSGLLKQIESENELVMILGHELGHFAHRDHLRAMGRGLLFTFFSVSLMGSNSGLANFVGSTVTSLDLKYSRGQELSADEYGLDLLNKYYGHIAGATDFFERIENEKKESVFIKFISTHPVGHKRVAQIEHLIAQKNYVLGKRLPLADTAMSTP